MGRTKSANYITFICDRPDCDEEKIEKEALYKTSKNHYCSIECYYMARYPNSYNRPAKKRNVKPKDVKKMKGRRQSVIIRFNSTAWGENRCS